jgi:hypothetical protein
MVYHDRAIHEQVIALVVEGMLSANAAGSSELF